MALKVLGDIVARISADPSGFVSGVDKAKRSTSGLKKEITSLKAAAGAIAGAFAAIGIKDFVSDQLAAIDATAKFANRLGETFGNIEKLGFIAEQSGIQVNQMNTAVQRLTRRTGEAMMGNTELLKTFQLLNINVREFTELDIVEKLIALDKATGNLNTREEQLAALMKLVDTEGIALIQSFDGQGQAIADLAARYEASGMVITDEQARMVEEVSTAWINVRSEWDKAAKFFVADMAPQLIDAMKFIGDASFKLAGAIKVTWNSITSAVAIGVKTIIDGVNKLAQSETLTKISDALQTGIVTDQEDMQSGFKMIMEGLAGVGNAAGDAGVKVGGFVDELGKLSGSGGRSGRTRRGRLPGLPRAESPEFDDAGVFGEEFEDQRMMQQLDEIFADINRELERQIDIYGELEDVTGRFITDAIKDWNNLGDVVKRFEQEILDKLMQKLVVGPLTDAIGGALGGIFGGGTAGGGIGGFIGSIFGGGGATPARAVGGIGLNPFIAGEQGPELIVPGVGGAAAQRIEPGDSGAVTVNMNISTPDAASFLNPRSRSQLENAARGIGSAAHRSRAM